MVLTGRKCTLEKNPGKKIVLAFFFSFLYKQLGHLIGNLMVLDYKGIGFPKYVRVAQIDLHAFTICYCSLYT